MNRKSSVVIVWHKDKKRVLLLKKGSCWGNPGGKAEPKEDPYKTAIRELKEETGLEVDKEELDYLSIDTVAFGDQLHDVSVFQCTKNFEERDVTISDEHSAFEFVRPIDAICFKELFGKLTMRLLLASMGGELLGFNFDESEFLTPEKCFHPETLKFIKERQNKENWKI